MANLTEQYVQIKRRYPDVLLFRLGDFYALHDDARAVARLIGATVADQELPGGGRTVACALASAHAEATIARLGAVGRKVAICERTGAAR